ncbi:MAG TPA: NmrA/HSCARG family protein [Steroidobacteraceae bacterium]|nr:NmrA/HSCARG family protein [Steroidobacteraceae bacterium]
MSKPISKPIVTVFGATGAQGGGLARALLSDPGRHFAVRAVTRKPDSTAARDLREAGAEIVLADIDDGCSVRRALEGAYGAFFVTNFWEHLSGEKEESQAQNLAGAAAQAGIRHAIWSTLEDTRRFFPADGRRMPVLERRYNVPHFDAKGAANEFFARHRVPTTYLYTSCYLENLIHFGMGPQRAADGSLAITFPIAEARIPWVAAGDIGLAAAEIFLRGDALIGDSIGIAGDQLTGAELAAALSLALGETVTFDAVEPDAFRALGFDGADEMGNMWQFKRDFAAEFCGRRDLARARALHPGMLTVAAWLAANKARLPVARAA